MLATTLPRQLGHGTVLLSHASDGAVEMTWPQHNVDAESYWRWYYRGDFAVARYRSRVMLVTLMLSHAGDGAADVT
jgi:hypothetical protein